MTTTIAPAPRPAGSLQSIWDLCRDIFTNHYSDFSGTIDRRTFWTFYFARLIACFATMIIPFVGVAINLGTVVPLLAVGARRLHETGHSGWWQLLNLVPVLGWIVLWIMLARPAKVITTS